MNGARALVTGGAGFIGSNLANVLADRNEVVVGRLNDELGTSVDPLYVENPIPEDVYVHHICADSEKIERVTGWSPTVGFEEGIGRVCAQY